jgi:hypothetical protein
MDQAEALGYASCLNIIFKPLTCDISSLAFTRNFLHRLRYLGCRERVHHTPYLSDNCFHAHDPRNPRLEESSRSAQSVHAITAKT